MRIVDFVNIKDIVFEHTIMIYSEQDDVANDRLFVIDYAGLYVAIYS